MRMLLAALLGISLLAGPAKPNPCLSCHDVDAEKFARSAHAKVACTACHPGTERQPHVGKPGKVDCASCHASQVKAYQGSVHGLALKQGDGQAATCTSCHGVAHQALKSSDAAAPTAKANLATTCGNCHSNPDFLAKHKLGMAKPVEAYRNSTHGRQVAKGNAGAPSCSDCHGSHDVRKGSDPTNPTHRANISASCGACHPDVQKAFEESVHGGAVKRGIQGAPTCTDCHGEHNILAPSEPGSLVNPARVSKATCARCHGDARLAERYNLGADKVAAFEDSFHGLALKGGSATAANCASCHGVHNILPSTDPRSLIHANNLGATCGKCHQGIGTKFITGRVHILPGTDSEHPVVRWIRITYVWTIIPLTIGFMLLHNALDWFKKVRHRKVHHRSEEMVERMNLRFRIAHGMVIVSFITLVVTGFALKYPDAIWAQPFMAFEAKFPFRAWLHRAAAVVISFGTAFHLVHLAVVKRDRVILKELLPTLQDAKDLVGVMAYNVGLRKTKPTFGMFNYAEKMEYWAYMWGTVVMAATGLILWANNWSLQKFPKWVSDAATTLHWYEAILASLSIAIWHWYAVIFDPDVYPMDMAWLTGKVPADHLKESRPEYYQRLKAKDGEGAGQE